jgi:hypothetical protein
LQSNNSAAVDTLQSACEDRQVEVIIEQHGEAQCVALRYSTWTEGLGWCAQKTIRIDADQLDDLHRAITAARHRIKRNRADEGHVSEASRVIQFPALG